MCGRFLLTSPPESVGREFDLAIRDNFPPRDDIRPTEPIAIIRRGDAAAREYALVRWGFIPSFAKDARERARGRPLINARGESVMTNGMFRHAFRRRRCLVPADGFYEWTGEKRARRRYTLTPAAGGLVALAAIFETAHDGAGGEIDTAAIITTAAGADVAPLHDREPVVIRRENYARWLEAEAMEAAAAMLEAPGAGFWRAAPYVEPADPAAPLLL